MKGAVCILLLVTLAYLGETIRMPYYLVEQARLAAASCCPMEKGQQCPNMHPGKSSSHSMKDMKGCCNPAANCNTCPLCYTAELTASYTSLGCPDVIKKGYPETPAQPLADYAASSWKPPNA